MQCHKLLGFINNSRTSISCQLQSWKEDWNFSIAKHCNDVWSGWEWSIGIGNNRRTLKTRSQWSHRRDMHVFLLLWELFSPIAHIAEALVLPLNLEWASTERIEFHHQTSFNPTSSGCILRATMREQWARNSIILDGSRPVPALPRPSIPSFPTFPTFPSTASPTRRRWQAPGLSLRDVAAFVIGLLPDSVIVSPLHHLAHQSLVCYHSSGHCVAGRWSLAGMDFDNLFGRLTSLSTTRTNWLLVKTFPWLINRPTSLINCKYKHSMLYRVYWKVRRVHHREDIWTDLCWCWKGMRDDFFGRNR